MKRTALAGTFFLIAGFAGLVLLASVLYSCRQGGTPHEMGTDAAPASSPDHTAMQVAPPPSRDADAGPSGRTVSLS